MSAGEASGDRLAAGLVREIRASRPEWRICGIGSRLMQKAGFELLLDITNTSAIGISESLRVLPSALLASLRTRRLIKRIRPDVFVAIDCQGINLSLAKAARKAGARVVYYIPPQNFLWNDTRHGKKTAARVDLFLNIYKSGHDFYKALGGRSVYCGHPLAEVENMPAHTRAAGSEGKTVVLATGSRGNELRRFIPLLAACARIIREHCPDVRFITPVIGPQHEQKVIKGFARRGIEVTALPGEGIFTQADAAIIKSGTMSLEAALALCPYTVFYRVSALSWFIMARLWGLKKKMQYISLPNILRKGELAREFIQYEARPAAIAEDIIPLITDERQAAKRVVLLQGFRREMTRENALFEKAAYPAPTEGGSCGGTRYAGASQALMDFIQMEFTK
jgi:lipid-A-disaccharide synthase